MKKIRIGLPVLLFVLALSACKEEDNGLNGPYRNWVTIFSNDNTPTLITDRGLYLHVTNPQGDSVFYEAGDRGNMLYTIVNAENATGTTHQVVMKEFLKATVKNFVTEADSNYEDRPLAQYMGGIVSSDYLNVLVKTYTSDMPVNSLELVRYPEEETHLETDSLPVIRFRLQHNVSSVKSSSTIQAVCFNLTPLSYEFPGARAFVLKFTWKQSNDESGEQGFDLRYVPDN